MANLAIFKPPELYQKMIGGKISFYIWTAEVDIFNGVWNIFVETYYLDRRKLTE